MWLSRSAVSQRLLLPLSRRALSNVTSDCRRRAVVESVDRLARNTSGLEMKLNTRTQEVIATESDYKSVRRETQEG